MNWKEIRENLYIVLMFSFSAICIVFSLYLIKIKDDCKTRVVGNSMNPTFYDQQILYGYPLSSASKIDRFDIITCKIDDDQYENGEKTIIKRVIGLPGEKVQIKENGEILINGERLEEEMNLDVIEEKKIGLAKEEIILNEDEFFVLGDNRNNSQDSRFYGPINFSNIRSKILFH